MIKLRSVNPSLKTLKTIGLSILVIALLFTRRWQQIVSPQVWDEDGTQIIQSYIVDGWSSIFLPVNGYLIVIPKFISFISIKISFLQYPIVSTIISWIFITAIGIAIALSPTKLKGKYICGISIFIIPSDPEVFGLPLYTFWWSAIMLFLLVLWDQERSKLLCRVLILVLCGLSSPVIVVVLPIFYIRQYLYRLHSDEHIIGLIATFIASIQIYYISLSSSGSFPSFTSLFANTIPKFFGGFLIGNWVGDYFCRLVVGILFVIVITIFSSHQKHLVSHWILIYLLISSIALSVARVDPYLIDQAKAGPRYFFFPFIITFWILIQSYYSFSKNNKKLKIFAIIAIFSAVFNSAPVWSREHDNLTWKEHALTCRLFPEYHIPVQYDGHRDTAWYLKINAQSCRSILQDSLLDSSIYNFYKTITFPYRIIPNPEGRTDWRINTSLQESNYSDDMVSYSKIVNSSFSIKHLDRLLITSSSESDSLIGDINLEMKRGDYFFYRSGPRANNQIILIKGQENRFLQQLPASDKWIKLVLSNPELPDKFKVIVRDLGSDWSAVAVDE